jgi:hypothetical protein
MSFVFILIQVDYLITEHNQSVVLAYDYAVSGNTVAGVEIQVNEKFLPHVGQKPAYARWNETNSLFSISIDGQANEVTWIGINDIQWRFDHNWALNQLFNHQETLYEAGARNFVIFSVPPFDRAPVSTSPAGKLIRRRPA